MNMNCRLLHSRDSAINFQPDKLVVAGSNPAEALIAS